MASKSKKKQKPNAFFFFMQDIGEQMRQQDGRVVGNRELADICGPMWVHVTDADRRVYEEQVQNWRVTGKIEKPRTGKAGYDRMDCTRQYMSERVDPQAEEMARLAEQRQLTAATWGCGIEGILDKQFNFISIKSLCDKMPDHIPDKYLPVEIGITKWSIRKGIMDSFHTFIKPKPIPMGYRSTCQEFSKATHMIPSEGHESVEQVNFTASYMRDLVIRIRDFLRPETTRPNDNSKPDPAFCVVNDYELVLWSLKFFCDNAQVSNKFELFETEALVTDLLKHMDVPGDRACLRVGVFNQAEFDYDPGLRCSWHSKAHGEPEPTDIGASHCALGCVKRICFIVFAHMREAFPEEMEDNVPRIVRGLHVPQTPDDDVTATVMIPESGCDGFVYDPTLSAKNPPKAWRYQGDDPVVTGFAALQVQQSSPSSLAPRESIMAPVFGSAPLRSVRSDARTVGAAAAVPDLRGDEDFPALGGAPQPRGEVRRYAQGPTAPPARAVPLPTSWLESQHPGATALGRGAPPGLGRSHMMADATPLGLGRGGGRYSPSSFSSTTTSPLGIGRGVLDDRHLSGSEVSSYVSSAPARRWGGLGRGGNM